MKELIIRGAIAMLLDMFTSAPHMLDPLKPALLKVFKVLWSCFQTDPDFQVVVGKPAAKAAGSK